MNANFCVCCCCSFLLLFILIYYFIFSQAFFNESVLQLQYSIISYVVWKVVSGRRKDKCMSRFAFYICKLQPSLYLLEVIICNHCSKPCAISRTLHVRSLHTHQRILHVETESSLLPGDQITRKIFYEKCISRSNMHARIIMQKQNEKKLSQPKFRQFFFI